MQKNWKSPCEHPGVELAVDTGYIDTFQPVDLVSCNQQRHTAKDRDLMVKIGHINGYQNLLA